ncbi:hypothetical protein LTR94_024508 [Friedmanniomyces endolithicus]|nr:hypothetical protein LTR94_024508 [Friedmanniomyces endolithicus]
MPSEAVEAFKVDLAKDPSNPEAVASRHAVGVGPSPLEPFRKVIDQAFDHDTVEAIVEALHKDGGEWALSQAAVLETKSPTSLKVTLRHLLAGADAASFGQNMAMEYALSGRIGSTHDFQEGVRAVIIDKDNAPAWAPSRLSDVQDATLDALFEPLASREAWTPFEG